MKIWKKYTYILCLVTLVFQTLKRLPCLPLRFVVDKEKWKHESSCNTKRQFYPQFAIFCLKKLFFCRRQTVKRFNFRLGIQTKVKVWPLIKNDPQVFLIYFTKIIKEAIKNWKFLIFKVFSYILLQKILGSIHIWRQVFFGYFWPTYLH